MSAGERDVEAEVATASIGREGRRAALALFRELVVPYKWLVVGMVATLLCDIVGMLYIPTELAALVNTAIAAHDTDALVGHGVSMLVAAVVGSGGCIASYYLASKFAANVGRDLRVRVYEKSLDLAHSDFEQFGTGSMITRTLSDANVVQQMLLMGFIMMGPVPVTCVVAILLAFGVDPVMGRLLVAVTLVILVIFGLAVWRSAPIFVMLQSFIDRMNVRLREYITGVRVIRAFGRESRERERLDSTFESYADRAIRVNLVFSTCDCATFFLMNVVESTILWVGADRVGAHAMQIGSISALIEYAMLIMFFMMMAQFAILQMPRGLACLSRAAQVLSATPVILDPEVPAELPSGDDVPAEVARFDHVSFRFGDADEDTLHNLDFALRRGEVTAVIGNTGSGKSTIAKMLLRFHDATGGRLLFLGRDVRDVSQHELRDRISYVPQRAWLFSGTIAQNLRDGDAEATDERLWHALDVAQASFVHELPDGLDARVSQGGTNFSGGQRQRLAIARALVRKADLYVFDDSFSALDFKTDAALRHALSGELEGAATLLIAQRVSTIRDADQIVVLDEGRLAGVGKHDELVRTCPTYRAIVESQQMEGGEADGE